MNSQAPATFERCGTIGFSTCSGGRRGKTDRVRIPVHDAEPPHTRTVCRFGGGHFRVHYDITGYNAPANTDAGGNGIPDFVDSTLVDLEYAWNKLIGLGYGKPKSDIGRGGSDAVDVYIQGAFPPEYLRLHEPDDSFISMGSSYMVIDNNFKENIYPTKGYAALRVTTAHEFFHMMHYSYYGGDNAAWWMEQSAVWFEDYTWDDVNDYLLYLDMFLSSRDIPLDTAGNYSYAASLFALMIAQKYGSDPSARSGTPSRTVRMEHHLLNTILPDGNPLALNELGVWSYFTGSRRELAEVFLSIPAMTSMVSAADTVRAIPATDSLTFKRFKFKYVTSPPSTGFSSADSLQFEFIERDGGLWKRSVILYNSPTDFETAQLTGSKPLLVFPRSYRKAVLVIANASTQFIDYRLVYSVARPSGNQEKPRRVHHRRNYPNPFNKETVIQFTVPKTSRVKLRILNIGGQTVDVLTNKVWDPGTYTITYTPSHLSSGVYFAVLESGNSFIARKMAFVK